MKPDINQSLAVLAQELIHRNVPLLEDEYEQSRLNSWGVLLILASMNLDTAVDNLNEQNKLMDNWFSRFLERIKDKDLKIKIRNLTSETTENIKFSTLDIRNQKLRRILVQAQTYFEKKQDSEAIIECWKILRTMHSHRKISHLLSILQGK